MMASDDKKITELDTGTPADTDPFEFVDADDTSDAASGKNKQATFADVAHNLLDAIQGSADGYHVSSSDFSALTDVDAQLTALQTDGSPTFVAGTFTGTTEFSNSTLAADFTGGQVRIGGYQLKSYAAALGVRNNDDTGNENMLMSKLELTDNNIPLKLRYGGQLTTANDGDITLAPDGTGITKTSGFSTSHSLNSPGDLGVAGDLEVHGITRLDFTVYIDGATYCYSALTHPDGRKHRYGSDFDAVWSWNDSVGLVDCVTGGSGPLALPAPQEANEPTLQTNNTLTMSVDEGNNELNVTVKKSDGTTVSGTIALS